MNKSLILVLTIIFLAGCEKNDIEKIDKNLLNCSVEYLNFTDNFLFENQEIIYAPSEPLETKIYLEYENKRVTRITGGVIYLPGGTALLGSLLFSTEAYDSIHYSPDSILVYSKPEADFLFFDDSRKPIIYLIDSNDQLVKIIHRSGNEFTYEYSSDNIITEESNDLRKTRKFYLKNNNLVKVVTERMDDSGLVVTKKEILFKNYDENPNPFYSKYFVLGAFYRAFSANNYEKYVINEYSLDENEFKLTSSFTYSMPIKYSRNGYPMFGDYE